MDDESKRTRVDVDRHEFMLRGDPVTGKGGLISVVDKTSDLISNEQHGLVVQNERLRQRVEELEKWRLKVAGGLAVFVVLLEIIIKVAAKHTP